MNEFQPLVSVVIPVYNGNDYMRETMRLFVLMMRGCRIFFERARAYADNLI